MKRITELDADKAKEAREAKRWYRRNAHKVDDVEDEGRGSSRPRKRLGTGAAEREQVVALEPLMNERVADDEVVYAEGHRFVPLIANLFPLVEDEDRERMNEQVESTMAMLRAPHRDLLYAYYVEGTTQEALAANGESRQAVSQRLKRAREAFARIWVEMGY